LGDREGSEGGKGGKGGPRGPIGGLVKLCLSLAEEAAEKREFDYESALVDICAFILAQKPEETTDSEMMGPPPTGAPSERSFFARAKGGRKGGDKQGKGEGQSKGAEGAGEEKDLVDVLVNICKGLAEMAEKAEVEARAIETKEDLMEAMKVVCDAAKAEADARKATTASPL